MRRLLGHTVNEKFQVYLWYINLKHHWPILILSLNVYLSIRANIDIYITMFKYILSGMFLNNQKLAFSNEIS